MNPPVGLEPAGDNHHAPRCKINIWHPGGTRVEREPPRRESRPLGVHERPRRIPAAHSRSSEHHGHRWGLRAEMQHPNQGKCRSEASRLTSHNEP